MKTLQAEVLWVARYDYPEGWKMNIPHEHDYYQIIFTIDGTGRFLLDNEEHQVFPGQLFFMKPYQVHRLLAVHKTTLKTFDIKFLVHDLEIILLLEKANSVLNILNPEVQGLFKKIREEGLSKRAFYKEFSCLYLMQLLMTLIRATEQQAEETFEEIDETFSMEESQDLCNRVMDYVKQSYKEELSLKTIGDALGYNQSYICQVFKSHLKTTPMRFLYTYRIFKAKELIASFDYNLKQVAALTGFKTVHHFTRLFHESEGLTPGQWRKREREGIRKGVFIDESFRNQNIIHPS